MKILHTADLHLKKEEEKRVEILRWLVNKVNEAKAELFIIAGDLFDSDTDATVLRPVVKKIFEGAKSQVLIIPGNHDENSYRPEYDYGDNVIQLVKKPFEIYAVNNLIIAAVPYQNVQFSNCIKEIPKDIDIIIAHGTLYDQSFIFAMLDDEARYMPIFPANLENLSRYAALGHLHARSIKTQYKKTQVVYPGSPIAIDSKCNQERVCMLVEVDKNRLAINALTVDISPYWQQKDFFVFPGIEEKILKDIEQYLKNLDKTKIMPSIDIKGFIGGGDREFASCVSKMKSTFGVGFSDIRIDAGKIQSWDRVIQNPMVKRFVEKTQSLDDKLRLKVFELTLPIFSEVIK